MSYLQETGPSEEAATAIEMPPWVIEASAPGKAILHGEHSVVYGKTGVVVSIDLRTKAVLRGPNPYNRKCFTVSLPDLGRSYDFSIDSLRQFICCHSNLLLDASTTQYDQVGRILPRSRCFFIKYISATMYLLSP